MYNSPQMVKLKQELIRRHHRELCDMLETHTDLLEAETRELVEELEDIKLSAVTEMKSITEYRRWQAISPQEPVWKIWRGGVLEQENSKI